VLKAARQESICRGIEMLPEPTAGFRTFVRLAEAAIQSGIKLGALFHGTFSSLSANAATLF